MRGLGCCALLVLCIRVLGIQCLVFLVSCHNHMYMDLIGVSATVSVTFASDAVVSTNVVRVVASPETGGLSKHRGNSLELEHTLLSHKVVGMWKCISIADPYACVLFARLK